MLPFQIGSISFAPSSVNKVEIGPTSNPIRIRGRMAGSLSLQATHCATIPRMTIPASSIMCWFLR